MPYVFGPDVFHIFLDLLHLVCPLLFLHNLDSLKDKIQNNIEYPCILMDLRFFPPNAETGVVDFEDGDH